MRLPINEDDSSVPNLTPMIDVVFLLLIFFLVATTFQEEEKDQEIKLAAVVEVEPMGISSSQITVNINKDGDFIVMKKALSDKELQSLLMQEAEVNPHKKVQIRADGDVQHKYVAHVIGYCQKAGLEYTNKVVERKF